MKNLIIVTVGLFLLAGCGLEKLLDTNKPTTQKCTNEFRTEYLGWKQATLDSLDKVNKKNSTLEQLATKENMQDADMVRSIRGVVNSTQKDVTKLRNSALEFKKKYSGFVCYNQDVKNEKTEINVDSDTSDIVKRCDDYTKKFNDKLIALPISKE